MSLSIDSYKGGVPLLYTRPLRGQRGGGFFSSLKRFLIPIGKAVVPSLLRGVGDVVGGKSTVKEALKKRGIEAGKKALGSVVTNLTGNDGAAPASPAPPPRKKYKRAKRSKNSSSNWQ